MKELRKTKDREPIKNYKTKRVWELRGKTFIWIHIKMLYRLSQYPARHYCIINHLHFLKVLALKHQITLKSSKQNNQNKNFHYLSWPIIRIVTKKMAEREVSALSPYISAFIAKLLMQCIAKLIFKGHLIVFHLNKGRFLCVHLCVHKWAAWWIIPVIRR